jgi:hypothetical protein
VFHGKIQPLFRIVPSLFREIRKRDVGRLSRIGQDEILTDAMKIIRI